MRVEHTGRIFSRPVVGYLASFVLLTCLAILGVLTWSSIRNGGANAADLGEDSDASQEAEAKVRVKTILPQVRTLDHVTAPTGSVYSYETAELFAKVSGYLAKQTVDIGAMVKRGDVLAVIDAPELQIQVDQDLAALKLARSEVEQARARVVSAKAKQTALNAAVAEAEANVQRAGAQKRFREKQYQRIKQLVEKHSIQEELADEKLDELETAEAAEHLAQAAIITAKANVSTAEAEVQQASADVTIAESRVDVAQAALEKSKVIAAFTTIISPFDGVITKRNYFPGDFIRDADRGNALPLLVVNRTDKVRIVTQIPDRDAPLTNPGDEATVEMDSLPGEVYTCKVSRIADAEDSHTRTMRAEIDLDNRDGRLRQGMYGLVNIKLDTHLKCLTIPSACLVGALKDGKGSVYVARGEKVYLTAVDVSADDGVHLEIRRGLTEKDEVVQTASGALGDGMTVNVIRNGKT